MSLTLVELAASLGTRLPDGGMRLLALTHQTLAEYVGTSREIVTAQLNRLKRQGLVRYTRSILNCLTCTKEPNLRKSQFSTGQFSTGVDTTAQPANGTAPAGESGSNTVAERISPDWGHPLTENDYANLRSSWITPEIADNAKLRRVDSSEGRYIGGRKDNRDYAGILIPYYWPGDPKPTSYRLRRDHPEMTRGADGHLKPELKYVSAPGASNRLYLAPGTTVDALADIETPIVIVGGEKKALALARLAQYESTVPRFIPVGIAGVWNFRGTIGKVAGPNGERVNERGPIPDLSRIPWAARKALLFFDSNVHANGSVREARRHLAAELRRRHAECFFVDLPANCDLNGVDDALFRWGPDRVLELFTSSCRPAEVRSAPPLAFEERSDGIYRIVKEGEYDRAIQLTNFTARITANTVVDDGQSTECEFQIDAVLRENAYRFNIRASDFSRMEWALKHIGPLAAIFPRQEAYAKVAIQLLSNNLEERRTYTHTGWTVLDGRPVFLHGGGAIGSSGLIDDVQVNLPGALSRYRLPDPPRAEALQRAIRASLNLVDLGPPGVIFPFFATVYRSVLGEADFGIHLAGETGVFKTELAALLQQHFGSGLDRLHLPTSWSSTANALEVLAHHAKDALLTVDDFAPQANAADAARYHSIADRLFRGAGNRAGRGRLDSAANLRDPKPPRALVVSTGEDLPRGHSLCARVLILEMTRGAVRSADLAARQNEAREGLYAQSMAGFVHWLANGYDSIRARFADKVSACRTQVLDRAPHARTPEIVSNLQAAFELFLDFAVDAEAIESGSRMVLAKRCWNALREAAAAQRKYQSASEPTSQFLETLRSLLGAGRAHLASRDGGVPEAFAGSSGWRKGTNEWMPRGDCVGWLDGDDIYLDPKTAYRLVQAAGRDSGEVLPISELILKKRLRERNLLASFEEARETLTVRRRIQGSSKEVLHLKRITLLPDGSESSVEEATK